MQAMRILAAIALAGFAHAALAQEHEASHTMPMAHAPMSMQGMYGPYPMTREASGTSWQPDATPMEGIHTMSGDWMTMWHGYVALFGRIEQVANDELFREGEALHGAFKVGKLSLGFVHDFASAGPVRFGAGALVSRYWKPAALDRFYGNNPTSSMVFLRAKLAM